MTGPRSPICEINFSGPGGPWFAEPGAAFAYLAEVLDGRPDAWAWSLTPLTTRVIGGLLAAGHVWAGDRCGRALELVPSPA